jgi:hypothetical protein
MGIRAGSLARRPQMNLTFEVRLARKVLTRVATNIDTTATWTELPRRIMCDIMPLQDETYFLQSGEQTIASHSIHFHAREDIRISDLVQFVHSRRLAGPVGSWYEILRVLAPTETLAYIRAYAFLTDAPTGLTKAFAQHDTATTETDTNAGTI